MTPKSYTYTWDKGNVIQYFKEFCAGNKGCGMEFSTCDVIMMFNKFQILEHFRFEIFRVGMLNVHVTLNSTVSKQENHIHPHQFL